MKASPLTNEVRGLTYRLKRAFVKVAVSSRGNISLHES